MANDAKSLPPTLAAHPNIDQWLAVRADRKMHLRTGKVELGQGIRTALAMICADELDLDVAQVVVEVVDTDLSPNEMMTAGSMSVEMSGAAIRQVSAEARFFLLTKAADRLDLPVEQLLVRDGLIYSRESNRQISYWELMEDQQFGIEVTGKIAPKSIDDLLVVGRSTERIDLRKKMTGQPAFIQDLQFDDLHHARVIRVPAIGAVLRSSKNELSEVIGSEVTLIVDGSFLAVVADSEQAAMVASEHVQTSVTWDLDAVVPLPTRWDVFLKDNAGLSLPVVDGTPVNEDVPAELFADNASVSLNSEYFKPFHMHASLAPSCAVAWVDNDRLNVWSHSQGPFVLRAALAQVFGIAQEVIRVTHVENSGCYGHNGADDAAFEAALIARAMPDTPIMLKWTRDDEHSSEPYSPAMVMQMQADLDASGRIETWNHEVFSNSHMGRPAPFGSVTNFVSAWHLATPVPRPEARPGMGRHGGIHRNADPYYEIANRRIVKHLVQKNPVRTSSTRGLGAFGNVFAIESFMDELADAAGCDPLEFRARHLTDPRALEVIERAHQCCADISLKERYTGTDIEHQQFGKGLAFARYKNAQTYAAVCMGLCVDVRTFQVQLLHAIIAADAGRVIDRDGLANQLEGGLIQASSWTLKEQVTFSGVEVASRDWQTYPILTFPEIPTVDIEIIDRPDSRPLGAGEATQGPTAAAIANAIFDATKLRPRQIPFTEDSLRLLALQS